MAQTTTQWILELVDKITSPMKGVMDASGTAASAVEGVGTRADESGEKLKKMSAIDLYAISEAVNNIADQFNKINEPGAQFNAQLKELEAITGVTGDALEDLGEKGRQTAKDFGGDASVALESYKGVLSRLGPDIASNQDALDLMGRNIFTLSKTMGNDGVGAMDALTTSMLQFGVDMSDPMEAAQEMSRMMNVMAAGSQEGASEVTQMAAAIKQAGVQALNSKVNFEQTNAALQALAQGGKYGSEAGVGLRNVLAKMAGLDVIPKQAADKLQALGVNYDIVSDKTLPFTTRLRELKKAQGDATVMAQVFGTENAASAEILLRSVDYQDELTKKITGTNVATEQASIIMSGYNEKMSRTKAWFTDLAIGAFDVTSKMTPFIDVTAGAVSVLANMANATKGIQMLFGVLKTMPVIGKLVTLGSSIASGGFAMMTTAAKVLGVAIMNIPILGWIAALVAALIALGVYFYKTSSTFRGFLWGLWEAVKTVFTGMGSFISEVAQGILDLLKGVFNPANWFDDSYSFSDGFSKISNAASEYGKSIGESFSKGREEGMEDFYAENPDKRPGAVTAKSTGTKKEKAGALEIASVSPVLTPTGLNGGGNKTGGGLEGSGGGSIKNITQKVDVKNYFTISAGADKSEYESIAEKLVRAINDKLSDGMVAASM